METHRQKITNVTVTNVTNDSLPRNVLLLWVNTALQTNIKTVNAMCTGALYCQFMHVLFPDCVDLKKVKFQAWFEPHRIHNFKMLQAIFEVLGVTRDIPILKLVTGNTFENLEFLQWFRQFFEANYQNQPYDALATRNGQVPKHTAPKVKSAAVQKKQIDCHDNCNLPENPETNKEIAKLQKRILEAKESREFYCEKLFRINEICLEHPDLKLANDVQNILMDGSPETNDSMN